MIVIFINMLLSLLTIDYYARTVRMGEADYLALMFGIAFISILVPVYYYIFSNTYELMKQTREKAKSYKRFS